MNPYLETLQPYPFQKLAEIKQGITPPAALPHTPLSIGEPKHPTPQFIREAVAGQTQGLGSYPVTKGSEALRQAIADWLVNRYGLAENAFDIEHQVLPVNGSREGLFSFAQAVINPDSKPLVVMPNPFYQIYEGAALLAGAEPHYLPCNAANGFIPDYAAVETSVWERCQLLYICSPGNPTGAVIDIETLQQLIRLAEKHDFIIASDECYSEIYRDEDNPPPGLLQAAAQMGNTRFERCIVFNSLSKRSSVPGLRSGFVAGDKEIMKGYFLYRTYHGCAMPPHHQAASLVAWQDEEHVRENRRLYRQKLEAVHHILRDVMDVELPEAGFYLWPGTPISDIAFTQGLFQKENITVLPGSFLSREVNGSNPGSNRIRMALVASVDECIDAAKRMRKYIESL
jgi:N-succinyldiaminopimelate aminotransferase